MPALEEDLVRIATLFLQVPGKVIKEYLGPTRYHELIDCYRRVQKQTSVPPQPNLFNEVTDGKDSGVQTSLKDA